ncbi:hypothetical protein [Nonlabens dokdonensis]|uniref:hypothetical protein n=1 Tax=Nonlabens dokdonensis TaxID=328515 RepID=UPI0011B46717|nr:hypothetical protein [Nonlabens dokdonensis]
MKITTDSIKYYFKIKELLTCDFDVNWTPEWIYCEMTSVPIEGHSWTLLVRNGSENFKLIYRSSKPSQQNEMNNLGVFNFDTIKINEKVVHISHNDISEIEHLLESNLTVNKTNRIILDGNDNELTDFENQNNYSWKLDEEISSNLKELVQTIKRIN